MIQRNTATIFPAGIKKAFDGGICTDPVYLALHNDTPTTTETHELREVTYTRQTIEPTDWEINEITGARHNTKKIVFNGDTHLWDIAKYWSLNTAETGGELLLADQLLVEININEIDKNIEFQPGAFLLGF